MSVRNKTAYVANFIDKLWEILHNQNLMHILTWNPQGVTFIIKDKQLFSRQILPRYFKHSNFASFVRQLNMYNFHKVRGSKHENEFSHNLFIKQKKQLLIGIRRKPSEVQIEYGRQLADIHQQQNKNPENNQYSRSMLTKNQNISKLLDDDFSNKKTDYVKENQQLKYENYLLEQQYIKSIQTNKKNMQKIGRFLTTMMSFHIKQSMFYDSNTRFDFQCFSKFFKHLQNEQNALTFFDYQKMMVTALFQDEKHEQKTEKTSQISQKCESLIQEQRIISISTHKILPNIILKPPTMLQE